MIRSWWYWCAVFCLIVITVTESNAWSILDKMNDEGNDKLSPDFMSFVKGLDSMVFKSERKKNNTEIETTSSTPKSTTKNLSYRKRANTDKENIKATQNAAIRDILMLKLVSYYEDKYNVGKTKAYSIPEMLERPKDHISFHNVNSVEKNIRQQNNRKMNHGWKSEPYAYNELAQDTNGVDQNNQYYVKDMAPHLDEVFVLR